MSDEKDKEEIVRLFREADDSGFTGYDDLASTGCFAAVLVVGSVIGVVLAVLWVVFL
jgi:hypothetical protein